MDLGSVLESELRQKWRYGALKGMYRLKLVSCESNSGFKARAKFELSVIDIIDFSRMIVT